MAKSKPRKIERGVVVEVRNARSGRRERRAIVMRRGEKYDPYTPAEFVVCSVNKRGETYLQERPAGLLVPVGRVKKMPKACRAAMRKGDVY